MEYQRKICDRKISLEIETNVIYKKNRNGSINLLYMSSMICQGN